MIRMRINLRDEQRRHLFDVDIDMQAPPSSVSAPNNPARRIYLLWEHALGDNGQLNRCPACGCRELFARKDFPQRLGLILVLAAGTAALFLFGFRQLLPALVVLGSLVGLDALIFLFAARCLVCYRCRSEFRKLPIHPKHPGWDLGTGEKYR